MAGRAVVALLANVALGVSGSAWASVEMRGFRLHSPSGPDGRFTGSVSAPIGDYALVPHPEVTGDLPADGAYPDPAPLSVVPPSSPRSPVDPSPA